MTKFEECKVIGIADNSVRSQSKIKGPSKGAVLDMQLVQNWQNIKQKSSRQLLQEDAKSKARTL